MNRIVFCPEESKLDEANKLSLLTNLSIQIGDSLKTKNLNFDRSIVSVILVPSQIYLNFKPNAKQGVATRIQIYDEWHSYNTNTCYMDIECDGLSYTEKPLFTEINSAVFAVRFKKIGINHFSIFNENVLIASQSTKVEDSC